MWCWVPIPTLGTAFGGLEAPYDHQKRLGGVRRSCKGHVQKKNLNGGERKGKAHHVTCKGPPDTGRWTAERCENHD